MHQNKHKPYYYNPQRKISTRPIRHFQKQIYHNQSPFTTQAKPTINIGRYNYTKNLPYPKNKANSFERSYRTINNKQIKSNGQYSENKYIGRQEISLRQRIGLSKGCEKQQRVKQSIKDDQQNRDTKQKLTQLKKLNQEINKRLDILIDQFRK